MIVFVWAWLFPYSAGLNNPNERTRVLQARALLAHGSLAIGEILVEPGPGGTKRWHAVDTYGQRHHYDAHAGRAFVNDVALVCHEPEAKPPDCAGMIFPAKAPGAALLGLPALAIADAAGLVPDGSEGETVATWVLRYGGVALPMLLFLIAFASLLRRAGVTAVFRRRAILATALGTTLLPYTLTFVGHALAGGAIIASAALLAPLTDICRPKKRGLDLAIAMTAGHVAGWAVLFEYHAFIAIIPLGIWVLASPHRARMLPGFALGAGLAALIHVELHTEMFGSALKTGHHFLMSAHNRASQAGGFLGIEMFSFRALVDHLFDPYMGLLQTMPWLFFGALVGFPYVFRKAKDESPAPVAGGLPRGLIKALAMGPVLYLIFVSSLGQWQTMNGWGFGPRYLLPAMFPLAFVATLGWFDLIRTDQPSRGSYLLGRVIAGLAAASVIIVVVNAAAFPSPPDGARNTFGEFALPLILEGYGARTPGLPLGLGAYALAPALIVAVLAALAVALGSDGGTTGRRRVWFAGATALVVGGLWLALITNSTPTPRDDARGAREFAASITEGVRPDHRGTFLGPLREPPRPARP